MATILVNANRKAFAEFWNCPCASKIPLATSGGTKAVATATPTTATDKRGETAEKAPAAPPAKAIIKSIAVGFVRAKISLVMGRSKWMKPMIMPMA